MTMVFIFGSLFFVELWKIIVLLFSVFFLLKIQDLLTNYFDKKIYLNQHKNTLFFIHSFSGKMGSDYIEKINSKVSTELAIKKFDNQSFGTDFPPLLKKEYKEHLIGGYPRLIYFKNEEIKVVKYKSLFRHLVKKNKNFGKFTDVVNQKIAQIQIEQSL